jgi:restriction modification system DNA specificity domain protein
MSEFKNLPSGWKIVRLEKVAPLQRGYDLPTDNIKEGLYPVVYSNGILRFHNEFKAKAPGVITGRSGTIGKVVYVEEDYWPHNTSLWVTNFYDNNPKFIYYMYINLNLARFSAGSGVPTLNRNDIHAQTIPLPPLDEQEKIAEILSTWDEAINLTINLIENKKQFKKALMQNLLTAKIRFPEFKDEWKFIKLSDLLDYEQPTQYLVSNENYDDSFDIPVLTAGKTFILGYTNETKNIFLDNLPVIIFDDFTTAMQFVNFPFKVKSSAIKILKQKDKLVNIKLIYEIMQMINFVADDHKRYWISEFQDIDIKLPNLNEQQKIAEVLTSCDDEINLLNLKLENFKKQKQGLMQKLLSGKVRI